MSRTALRISVTVGLLVVGVVIGLISGPIPTSLL